jgi:hypothetical protein
MTSSARSIVIFGIYLVLLGIVLIVTPNILLGVFGFEPTKEVWIRVLGAVVGVLGAYYIAMAKLGISVFYTATVFGRAWIFVSFVALVILGLEKPLLMLFGAVDLAGAVWTWTLLRREARDRTFG